MAETRANRRERARMLELVTGSMLYGRALRNSVAVAALALASCAHHARAPQRMAHAPASPMTADARTVVSVCPMPDASGVPAGGAWGVVCNAATGEPIVGVTASVGGKVALTSETGVFFVPVTPGDYEIVFYYGDCTIRATVHVGAGPTSPIQQSIDASRC